MKLGVNNAQLLSPERIVAVESEDLRLDGADNR